MTGQDLVEPAVGSQAAESDYVRQVVSELWPAGAVETRTRPRWRRAPAGSVELVVLPSLHRPRMLIRRRAGRSSATAIRTYRTSASGLALRKLQLLALPTRLGLARLHPHVVTVTPAGRAPTGLDEHLSDVLGQRLTSSIHIGPSRAVRKPVLQLMTEAGRCVAFVKVGTNPLTRALVAREAATLEQVNSSTWHRVRPPEVLFHGTWSGHEVLALRALSAARVEPVTEALRTAAMVEVADAGDPVRLGESSYVVDLARRLEVLPASREAGMLRAALASLVDVAGPVPLRFGAWHGDWTPWNMAADGARLMLWDWEHYEVDVPAGFDALHLAVNSAVRNGSPVRAAVRDVQEGSSDLLGPFQEAGAAAPLTVLLYVVHLASRYLEDGEVEAGTTLGDLPSWLESVLADEMDALTRRLL